MNSYKLSFYTINIVLLSYLCSCNNDEEYNSKRIKNRQQKYIDSIFTSKVKDLEFEVFKSNSNIIKSAFKYSEGKIQGPKIDFYINGSVESISFFNKHGEKVGNECFYHPNGNPKLFNFWRDKNELLFKMDFDWYGNFRSKEGKPYYIEYPSVIKCNEKADIYIATPLIPNHSTEVEILESNDPSTYVKYYNDIRQYHYNISFKESGFKKFFMKVTILDQSKIIITRDSTNFEIVVK